MSSKWDKLKGKIPDAPLSDMASAADKKFVEKVDILKSNYAQLPLPELMQTLVKFNDEWDEIEDRKKELNAEFEALGAHIREHFEAAGVTSMKTAEGRNFYLNIEPYVSVENRALFEEWVSGQADLDYLWSVHPQALSSLVKGFLEQGQDDQIPPHVKIFLKTSVRVRKS